MKNEIPLFFGKPSDKAILTPSKVINANRKLYKINKIKFPKFCTLSLFRELNEVIKSQFKVKIYNYNPDYANPIYIFDFQGTKIAYCNPGFGASVVGDALEELIALGMEYFIFIGGVGIIQENIKKGELLVPAKAIRDEGTSYHYAKPAKYAFPSKLMNGIITSYLKNKGIPFHLGVTWTTDAPYRETVRKIKKYRAERCLSVEMEASALFAVANYRKKHIGGIFLAGDLINPKSWSKRLKRKDLSKREFNQIAILNLSLEIFKKLSQGN